MFNLICCVKGMLFYLAMFKSQGCVGSHNCLCPWSLTSRLRTDLHLNQGNLNECLIIGVSLQRLSFLLPVFMNLDSNCKDWGRKCHLLSCPLVLLCLEDICCHLQPAHCISWENQKSFVPATIKEKKSYWNLVCTYSLQKGESILSLKLQEVALY